MMENNCCIYSSFIFLCNSLIAFLYEYYTYSILFLLLFTTSVIYHSNYNIYTNIIDKIGISLVVTYGGYLLYYKLFERDVEITKMQYIYTVFIIAAFLTTIYLFIYGYICTRFCFCTDITLSYMYHSLLHIIASFGHLLIILL
jgi:hypothetical protein